MFHHIVMLEFHAALSPSDHEEILRQCQAIKNALPGIDDLCFVCNASDRARSYTHAFVAAFENAAAHERYQQAPVHAALKQKIMTLSRQVVVLDYEA